MFQIVLVAAFGAVGALCRHFTSLVCLRLLGDYFPYGTLIVNVVGCFLLGVVMHLFETEALPIPAPYYSGVSVGFLGALTTFSTFGYQTVCHLEDGQWGLAGLNILANVALGLAAAAAGLAVARVWAS